LATYDARAVRLSMLQTHYAPVSAHQLDGGGAALKRLGALVHAGQVGIDPDAGAPDGA
jgi:hypothetical protein